MTIFAGGFSLGSSQEVPKTLRDSISKHVFSSIKDSGNRHLHDAPRFFLAKWDSGAFSEPAWRETPDGSVCAIAGDPLLIESGHRLNREQQIEKISPVNYPVRAEVLSRCRGSFALVRYSAKEERLYLATDAIGLRSIFYVIQDGFLIFSTMLRVLESLPEVQKDLSLLGMAELSTFLFPLAERTPYDGIKVLRESQILSTSGSSVKLYNYYDWSKPESLPDNPKDAAAELYNRFYESVRIRVGDDKNVYSFLSGGMDSRTIVATLITMGRRVESLNFSSNASQDQYYAQLFSREAEPLCRLHCLPGGIFPNFSLLALSAKAELEKSGKTAVDRPRFIWSGDGGSVGLGHVYMDELMLEIGNRGDIEGMVKHFMDFNKLSLQSSILTASARENLPRILLESVLKEFNRYPREDIGRQIYLFLLFNDQRRHLFKHFESIDQHGLELLTPFYDAEFLKAVAATPSQWGILHRLYGQFFECLPAFALKTPWQTYPGHLPCPIPSDQITSYQWARSSTPEKAGLVERSKIAMKIAMAFRREMKPQVFSGARIWRAALIHALGFRDYWYILRLLQVYQRHDSIARGGQNNA